MDYYSSQISKLIEELSRLPGIGAKSAQRLAFHIINMPKEQVQSLAGSMTEARENVRYCKQCHTLTDQELCPICSNSNRDAKHNHGGGDDEGFGGCTKRQENIKESIMCFTVRSRQCLGLDLETSN